MYSYARHSVYTCTKLLICSSSLYNAPNIRSQHSSPFIAIRGIVHHLVLFNIADMDDKSEEMNAILGAADLTVKIRDLATVDGIAKRIFELRQSAAKITKIDITSEFAEEDEEQEGPSTATGPEPPSDENKSDPPLTPKELKAAARKQKDEKAAQLTSPLTQILNIHHHPRRLPDTFHLARTVLNSLAIHATPRLLDSFRCTRTNTANITSRFLRTRSRYPTDSKRLIPGLRDLDARYGQCPRRRRNSDQRSIEELSGGKETQFRMARLRSNNLPNPKPSLGGSDIYFTHPPLPARLGFRSPAPRWIPSSSYQCTRL